MTSRPSPGAAFLDARREFLASSGWFDATWYAARVGRAGFSDATEALEHFLTVGSVRGIAPNADIARMQSGPYAVRARDEDETDVPAANDPQLRREIALVAASGIFDADFYAATYPKVAERVADLVLHFCRYGWREVKQPSATFDLWHYWYAHLDPARDELNPLIHYLLMGMPASWSTRAAWKPPRPGARLPGDRPVRRACLFAAYDADGVLDDSLVAYVEELSRHCDVFFLADCFVEASELEKVAGITEAAWAIRHGAYDFGSYSMLARDLVGWECLSGYDEVLLVNDSCYLLRPLDEVFARMDGRACDWWGLQATKGVARTATPVQDVTAAPVPMDTVRDELLREFAEEPEYDFLVGSYFLAFRHPVVEDAGFRRILDSVHRQRGKAAIIHKYEIGLTQYLLSKGFGIDTFVDALFPFQPVFTNQYFRLLAQGFPLLKKYFLYQNHYDTPDLRDWKKRIREVVPGAPVEMMERNLLRTSPDDRLQRSFAIVTETDGSVSVPHERDADEFREADQATPVFSHWWAFVVGGDGWLSTSSSVLLHEVAQDPSLKKIVLTRNRSVAVDGENIVVAPMASPQGEYQLLRAGVVVVSEAPRVTLPLPLDDRHRVVMLRDGVTFERRTPPAVRPLRVRRDRHSPVSMFSAASDVDRAAVTADLYPVSYEAGFAGGLPAHDVLLCPSDALPAALREQEQRLSAQLRGRRLVVVIPPSGDPGHALFDEEDVAWLSDWSTRHEAVLGVRDDADEHRRATWRALNGVALDLGGRRYPSTTVVLRIADAVVAARPGQVLDFSITGRPVVPYLPDRAPARSWYHELDHAMPAPVVRDPAHLRTTLETLFGEPPAPVDRKYQRARKLFAGSPEAHCGWRVAQRLRLLATEGR
ncbi:rhamnan synthesis F family protein [Mumia zhuanghuii]|uniref:rhamnan synthesis F family protein n=1 Tax=Mumia zhuanghuii TaxID=2585211 RepID=UPI003634CAD4